MKCRIEYSTCMHKYKGPGHYAWYGHYLYASQIQDYTITMFSSIWWSTQRVSTIITAFSIFVAPAHLWKPAYFTWMITYKSSIMSSWNNYGFVMRLWGTMCLYQRRMKLLNSTKPQEEPGKPLMNHWKLSTQICIGLICAEPYIPGLI